MGYVSVVHRFREQVTAQSPTVAMRYSVGGDWHDWTWGQYGQAVEEVAAGLIAAGVEAGDRVGLLAGNRPEWHIADLAVLSVGAVTVPVYPTSSSSQAAYVLADSGARLCFVDSSEQLAKIFLHFEELPDLARVVGLGSFPGFDRDAVMTDLEELRRQGIEHLAETPNAVEARVDGITDGGFATLVYTSGTTGPPKGTTLTHANIEWTLEAVQEIVGLTSEDRVLSYLPLSHIAERVTSHFGQILAGGETWFARSLATVPEDLRACRPTIFMAVPRVWQKFHDAILDNIASQPRPMRALIERYITLGLEHVEAKADASHESLQHRLAYESLDHSIGARLRHEIGLEKARLLVSSAAPIHPDLVRWFHGIGLPIAEVWGQTEDCGPATMNPPDDIRIGTIGKPIPGLEIRTTEAGELQVRGGSVCAGYFNNADATAELIDSDGWMSTGDLGAIDHDGYVRITGRSKDLIINAAGKNISPSEIEGRLTMEPLIGQAVVVGDGQRYLVALLTLDADEVADWAQAHGTFTDIAVLVNDPLIRAEIESAVERVNREHAPVEQIKYWRLLPAVLTVEGGELTPTMKVKRSVVVERNSDLVDEMYAQPAV